MAAPRRSTARTAVLPARRQAPSLARLAPSGRSVLIGLAILALALGGYFTARETSVFAVRTLDVRGATPELRAEVRKALAPAVGKSLLQIDGTTLGRRIAPLPGVRTFTYDRAFPNTLRVVVRPEVPVLVIRQGHAAYLVAASGRVIRPLQHPRLSHLPRLWVAPEMNVAVGEPLPPSAAVAATVLAPLRGAPLPGGVRVIRLGKELTLVLGSGLEVRLGDPGDLRLKLAVARRILRQTGAAAAGGGYVDVSVPERSVLSTNPPVEG